MPKFDVKKTFKGALRGRYVREFVAGQTGIEIDDPDLAQVALAEGWIESHIEPIEGVKDGEFPEDYTHYVALQEIQIDESGDLILPGDKFGMSAEQAEDLIDTGLIAEEGSMAANAVIEARLALEASAEKAQAEKAATEAPKNKAAKVAPKVKDAATE